MVKRVSSPTAEEFDIAVCERPEQLQVPECFVLFLGFAF